MKRKGARQGLFLAPLRFTFYVLPDVFTNRMLPPGPVVAEDTVLKVDRVTDPFFLKQMAQVKVGVFAGIVFGGGQDKVVVAQRIERAGIAEAGQIIDGVAEENVVVVKPVEVGADVERAAHGDELAELPGLL